MFGRGSKLSIIGGAVIIDEKSLNKKILLALNGFLGGRMACFIGKAGL